MADSILCYSDTHLRSIGSFAPYNVVSGIGLTQELKNILRGFNWVSNQILERRPKLVVNCGDTYHNTEYISNMTIYGSALAFQAIKAACDEVGCQHLILPGNHDILAQDSNWMVTSVANLEGYGTVLRKESILPLDGFNIGFIPHNKSPEVALGHLLAFAQETDLIMAHQDFQGSKYDSGKVSESSLPNKYGIPVISGDIHTFQDIGDIHYVGSLIQNKFHRNDLEKVGGILLFDMNSKEIERHPNTGSKHYVKINFEEDKEKLASLPRDRVILQVSSQQALQDIEADLEGYEYTYAKAFIPKGKNSSEETVLAGLEMESPKHLLRDYIKKNNPDVLSVFDSKLEHFHAG